MDSTLKRNWVIERKKCRDPTLKRIHNAKSRRKKLDDCWLWIPPRSEFMKPKYTIVEGFADKLPPPQQEQQQLSQF